MTYAHDTHMASSDKRPTVPLEAGATETTTIAAGDPAAGGRHPARLARRRQHQAMFDATLKEIFLPQHVLLGEPIAEASLHTVVYSGTFMGESVAIKILTLAEDSLQDAVSTYGAFKVECEKTTVLSRHHKSILQVIEYGDAELPETMPDELKEFFPLGLVPFMIMERAPYGSLDTAMKRIRQLPGFSRFSLLQALVHATDGIKESHDHSVAHRDIKPQNILIFGPTIGKIADFGIARWRSRYEQLELLELTPKYCSPEQAGYALTGRSEHQIGMVGDVYSWAIMVYELVTGKHPFQWAIKPKRSGRESQQAILRAIATNDRRGFKPIGDIAFDSLMDLCCMPYKNRVRDIAVANKILREFVRRQVELKQKRSAGSE